MSDFIQRLHQQAIEAVQSFARAEATLLEIIMELDDRRGYRELGCTSLFEYATRKLKLTDGVAFNLIAVARKSREVPALKDEIVRGGLSISQARRISPVLNGENHAEWIEKAQTLTQRALEKEIARIAPKTLTPERASYVTETRLLVSLGVSEELFRKLQRIQDLVSRSQQKPATLEESIEAMAESYLEKNDPVRKAERAAERAKPDSSQVSEEDSSSIPASVLHEVHLRDQNRCTAVDFKTKQRCTQTRWIHIHHIIPVSEGGQNSTENLRTLCSAHHQYLHDVERRGLRANG